MKEHTNKLKQNSLTQLPYERCRDYGPGVLSDSELIAVLLRTGTKDADVLALADRLVKLHPYDGISCLLHMPMEEYLSVKGIGEVKAIQLMCVGEISKRIWRHENLRSAKTFANAQSVAAFYMQEMKNLEREELRVVFLDIRKRLITDMVLTKGTVNASLVCVRDILIEALRHRAMGIVLMHNHPSGNPHPSEEDIRVTTCTADGCRAVGIQLVDHIIIGEDSYFSFEERGLLN